MRGSRKRIALPLLISTTNEGLPCYNHNNISKHSIITRPAFYFACRLPCLMQLSFARQCMCSPDLSQGNSKLIQFVYSSQSKYQTLGMQIQPIDGTLNTLNHYRLTETHPTSAGTDLKNHSNLCLNTKNIIVSHSNRIHRSVWYGEQNSCKEGDLKAHLTSNFDVAHD